MYADYCAVCGGVADVCHVYADYYGGWQMSVMYTLITMEGWQVSVMCMLITVEGGRCLSCVC